MLGNYTKLYDEIQEHLERWHLVSERLQTKNNTIGAEDQVILPQPYNDRTGFEVDSSRPLVSVIARIIPSPDWFIGVHDVSLCNSSGHWILEKRITLFPFDAGTAEYKSTDQESIVSTNPQKSISQLKEDSSRISHFERGMGFIRFQLIEHYEDGSPVVVIDEDNCPNVASLRKVYLLIWFMLVATMILIEF